VRFQLHLIESGESICNRNRIMTGVRFLFRVTLRRHDLAAEVWHLKEPQKLPPVLSPEEVKRVLAMATPSISPVRLFNFVAAVRDHHCGQPPTTTATLLDKRVLCA
jgi:site-specific recombinase XerD